MDLAALLSEHSPRWSSTGSLILDCVFTENHSHRSGSGKGSLSLSPAHGTYHCYSCGFKGGLKYLLTEILELDEFAVAEAIAEAPDRALRKVGDYYELTEILELSPPKVYLERGFTPELLRKFKVGRIVYDNGKKRRKLTCIPLYELGKLKGLQYRAETPEGKMVWNTDSFDGSNFLYNWQPKKPEPILVEGYADVWRLHSYGLHAEGTLGGAITAGKMNKLAEREIVYVAMDNDLPGVRFAEKVYHWLKDLVELRFIPYPGKDPDVCSKRHFLRAMAQWLDYSAYSYGRLIEYAGDEEDFSDNQYYQIQLAEARAAAKRDE